MFLQRPSLSRSQDVSHILASVFRDLTRGSVGEQTVKNLTVSRSGEEGYHEKYVERLANVSIWSIRVIKFDIVGEFCWSVTI